MTDDPQEMPAVVWFAAESRSNPVRCCICGGLGDETSLELHHLERRGADCDPNAGWASDELQSDLVAAHPRCHRWIHLLIDGDEALSDFVPTRSASQQAIIRLRNSISRTMTRWSSR